MLATFKGKNHSIGCQTMSSLMAILIITFLITLIDAQLDAPATIGDTSKRAGFLPSRGRRFWSIFDWTDNSGEKRTSRFLPMRGRKAGFQPMRGKKSSTDQFSEDYSYPMNSYENDMYLSRTSDDSLRSLDAGALGQIEKKAFHAMRGKKESEPYLTGDVYKKSRNFFHMRG